jgi:glucosamine--fructose-6-phosphate aminotransferase (isomerizing)
MCGIFGYAGEKDALALCLQGLERLEYRGYDSTGVAGVTKTGQIASCKAAGKLHQLKETLDLERLEIAIAHTRWATHGKVTTANAHPHLDTQEKIALVHNGIIENYTELRKILQKKGVHFRSETDSEVIVQWIAHCYRGDLLEAVCQTLHNIKGMFAIAVIHSDHPEEIIAAASDCPLSIGITDDCKETIISSDPNAFLGQSWNVLFLKKGEIARAKKGVVDVFDLDLKLMQKKTERLLNDTKPPSKEGFPHFMLKEIFEQPSTIQKALFGRSETLELKGLSDEEMKQKTQIWFVGCGTSYHAGLLGAMLCEEFAQIPAHAEIASEVRYRISMLPKDALVIAISQSGETADTLAAVREAKEHGCQVLGICNVANSTLTRSVDGALFLKAGPEVSVCSTKAFTSQMTVISLLAIYFARLRHLPTTALTQALEQIPSQVEEVLKLAPEIERIAKKYSHYNNFFFMGRRYMWPTCLEASLKLKEISYVHAGAYPAGELKHGPIALLDSQFPVAAFCANAQTQEKILSNIMEVKARSAPVIAFAPREMKAVESIADDIIWLPSTLDPIAPFLSTVAGQLFAYYIAKQKGCNIDQPRNLAKSVTVE